MARAFHKKSANWWQWEAPDLLEAIERGDNARASHALLEVSKWRYYRHDISPHVARVLQRPRGRSVRE